jgi:Tfp pilus assembly protein PilX
MSSSARRIKRAFARVLWYRRQPGDESGMALMLVVGSMLVLTMFAGAALTYAVGSMPLSRHDQDFSSALGAAQSGIDDYIRRLNANDSYWVNPDCSNTAMIGPKGKGCDLSPTAGWQHVDGSTSSKAPMFHYDIDTTTLSTSHFITVTSTGKVNGVTRTLQASVGRGGSTDFVYYTDFEDADPANTVVYPTPPSNQRCVSSYWWGTNARSANDSGCVEITFVGGDVLNGPVHTNDTPLMTNLNGTGPEFVGGPSQKYSVETPDPACATASASNHDWFGCWRWTNSNTPIFDKNPGPGEVLQLPDNSSELATDPGCQYVGQTRIKFTSNGQMQVWSPETTSSNSATTADCGGNSPNGVSIPVPTMQVIYASNNPSVSPHQCAANEIGDGLPIAGDVTMALQDQFCGQGNIYIEGTLQGRVTVGAENSIVVTGDLMLANGATGSDLLGLVAGNNVEIWHPWIATTTNTSTCLALQWTKTPAQVVSTTPGAHGGSYLGWQEGYFAGTGVNAVWHPGSWVTTNSGSKPFWQGPTSKPSGYSGSWVAANGNHSKAPQTGNVWQPGTWTANSDGTFSYSAGGWQTPGTNKYYQGENWTSTCSQYQTVTTYSEMWPHSLNPGYSGVKIYASIQTLQHSFLVQNYNQGNGSTARTIDVVGSIAQKYRGIVGCTGPSSTCFPTSGSQTGYFKSYNYDSRLATQAPPYFPQWQNAKWAVVRFGEVTAAYK